MAGVGKLLKQAAKMQKQMEEIQKQLAETVLETSSGGGAVTVKITASGDITAVAFDPDFLKEDAAFVGETLVEALREAQAKARAHSEEAMGAVSGGLGGMSGLFG